MSWSILSSSMFRILLRKYVRLPFFGSFPSFRHCISCSPYISSTRFTMSPVQFSPVLADSAISEAGICSTTFCISSMNVTAFSTIRFPLPIAFSSIPANSRVATAVVLPFLQPHTSTTLSINSP